MSYKRLQGLLASPNYRTCEKYDFDLHVFFASARMQQICCRDKTIQKIKSKSLILFCYFLVKLLVESHPLHADTSFVGFGLFLL